ncbi:MAG: response regulator [Firmicutes bacterium]|nr:response regulator [Bacillota bacterium]
MKIKLPFLKNGIMISTKITVIVLLIIFVNTVTIGIFSFIIHRNDSIQASQDRVMAIASSAAMSIVPAEFFEGLGAEDKEAYKQKEYYAHLQEQFKRVRDAENIVHFYAGSFDIDAFEAENLAKVGADGKPDVDMEKAMVMYIYAGLGASFSNLHDKVMPTVFIPPTVKPAAKPAFETKTTRVTAPYKFNVPGEGGKTVITEGIAAYAPIFDGDGNAIGLVGVLISIEDVLAKSNSFALVLTLISLAVFLIISWVPILYIRKSVAKPLKSLQAATNQIAQGNMNIDMPVRKTSDEVGMLSQDFSAMRENLVEKEKAEKELIRAEQEANRAKSDFLSRMSHEMRTPMNAIIGMTKIAAGTDDVAKLRYCLSTIGSSGAHLLGIINDVLDMSKIEAGKLELEFVSMNLEKMLMRVCNIVVGNMEKKKQKFNVLLSKDLALNYIADDLRLSQVITNLLSNAVKFTPEGGEITLAVEQSGQREDKRVLQFSVSDTGIGLTDEQTGRLFNAFEQADGNVSRKYGGTGLGLVISKNIVEKMGGRIWVESEAGSGSTFFFEVVLKRAPHQDTVIFDGIRPEDIKLLIVEGDPDARKRFFDITESFGISADSAKNVDEVFALVEAAGRANRAYDIIFLDYDMPGMNGIEVINSLKSRLDRNTVVIITSHLTWHRIEKLALESHLTRYIAKPVFPSSVLDAINEVVGTAVKALDITKTGAAKPVTDLSGVHVLLAEDVEVNREIFIALLEPTHLTVDCAENGLKAVEKFKEHPEKYDLIVMDIQMPEMDGYQATQAIRALEHPRAASIPIIAMTANAFREDVEKCLESGMNDHIAKPIDEKIVIEKIAHYTKK